MLYKLLEQRCLESDVPLYISTKDFTKAIDRIKHRALWASLEHCGIKAAYVELLKRLVQPTGRNRLDRQRERRVSDQKRHEARRSNEQPAV